jgi:hypothetical protein
MVLVVQEAPEKNRLHRGVELGHIVTGCDPFVLDGNEVAERKVKYHGYPCKQ